VCPLPLLLVPLVVFTRSCPCSCWSLRLHSPAPSDPGSPSSVLHSRARSFVPHSHPRSSVPRPYPHSLFLVRTSFAPSLVRAPVRSCPRSFVTPLVHMSFEPRSTALSFISSTLSSAPSSFVCCLCVPALVYAATALVGAVGRRS
jgi:hypothetical protein